MTVVGDFSVRGGIKTVVTAQYVKLEAQLISIGCELELRAESCDQTA